MWCSRNKAKIGEMTCATRYVVATTSPKWVYRFYKNLEACLGCPIGKRLARKIKPKLKPLPEQGPWGKDDHVSNRDTR